MAKKATSDKVDAKIPRVTILDRRLANPFGSPSVPITITTPGRWQFRVADAAVRTGRIHDMVANKGWIFVTPEELDGTPDDYGFRVSVEGRLVRGEKGSEVLMKIRQKDFDAVQDAKAASNIKSLGRKQTREAVAEATAREFGSEAADAVHGSFKVEDGRERIELEDTPPS